MFDVSPIYGYLGSLKHEPCGDFSEFQKIVNDSEIAFRNALTQCVLEKDGKGTILFQKDFEDLLESMQSDLNNALNGKDKEKINWLSFQVKKSEEAVKYIKRVRADLGDTQEEKQPKVKEKPIEVSKFEKKLQDFGEFLSVKDLTEIFGCTPRTITNWETKGWIVNVAETSDEVNALGRRKRGQEKRYRRDTILRSLVLRERFESQV